MDFNSWNIFWNICFIVLATLISFGNVLTIWIFFSLRRWKRSYSLLISLAVADLLVGILAIPLYIKATVSKRSAWRIISADADIFTGITSIYTLAVISVERMFAVGWPLRHRTINFRVYICAIIIPWVIAAIFTTLMVFWQLRMIGFGKHFYDIFSISGTPLLIICVANFVVWKKQKSPFRHQNHVNREVKLAKTLALITATSLLTWLPFQTLQALVFAKVVRLFFHIQLTTFIIKLLQFSNSLVNVIIYPFRIQEFKRTLGQILHFRVISFGRSSAMASPPAGTGSVVSLIRFANSTFTLKSLARQGI